MRYNHVAVILHWVMAIAFIGMLLSGLSFSVFDLDKSFKFQLYQVHKSCGVLLLIAVVFRIAWRLFSQIKRQIPALPEYMNSRDALAAKLGHFALYAAMIIMPLSGWALVSSSGYGLPTIVFGWFEWPHIPGVQGSNSVHEVAEKAHLIVAILFALLIVVHVAAVIKHAIIDHDNLMIRMWWK